MARRALSPLKVRLTHVSAVAALSGEVAVRLKSDADLLVSAAWLHDVGYASTVKDTGLHALDGARFLRLQNVPAPVVNLVAHHSYAVIEAELRGLRTTLETEFPYDPALPHEVLCYCDMTTGPSGERVDVDGRLTEIRGRYGPDNLVTQFIRRAEKEIVETVERVEQRLVGATQSK